MSTNPYAFDPRPPERIDHSKWSSDGTIRCGCGSENISTVDACVDSVTGEDLIMYWCRDCRRHFYVPSLTVRRADP